MKKTTNSSLDITNISPKSKLMQFNKYIAVVLIFIFAQHVIASNINTAPPASKYFSLNATAKDIYQKITSLRLQEARTALDAFKRNEPDNLIPYFLDNYLDFLTVYTNDDRAEFKRLMSNMEPRLAKISRGDVRSPYYLYTQAEIRLQWSLLHLRYGEYLSGMSDVKQAYALLEENQRKFPDFIANLKSLGIMHAMIGNIPDDYKWAVKALGGMSGSISQGLQELETVLKYAKTNDFVFEDETTVAYSVVQLNFNNAQDVSWNILKNSKLTPKTNPLAAYAIAMIAMKTGRNDDAVRILQESPTGGGYCLFQNQDYLLGLAKLRRLDADAHYALERFLNNYKGETGVKEGYQKLAWYHLINDNEIGYNTYMAYVKLKGSDNNESDKAALREAQSGEIPDQRLLKARLLFDGGYYKRAYDLMSGVESKYTGQHKQNVEYHYRMGRIAQKLGKSQEAIRYYKQSINLGSRDPWYFACNAALQLGLVYEEKRDYANARAAFNQCLGLKTEEYGGSLHTQAKAGLGRTKGK